MKTNRIIVFYSFFVCSFLLISGILTAKDSKQLFASLVFLPLVLYFGLKIIGSKTKKNKTVLKPTKEKPQHITINNIQNTIIQTTQIEKKQISPPDNQTSLPSIPQDIQDSNKRLFLRLIGTSGLALLFMAMFSKDAQASFFGSSPTGPSVVGLKDANGNKINPAEKHPTDGYEISEIDDTGSTAYYGFVKKDGSWYILQDTSGAFRYTKGSSDFSTNWTTRASLPYDYFNNVFS